MYNYIILIIRECDEKWDEKRIWKYMKRIVIIIWVVYVNNNRKKMIIWVKKSLWKNSLVVM